MSAAARQPWLRGPVSDTSLLLLPPFAATCLAWRWTTAGGGEAAALSPVAWLALVVFVDVAHVYATLYRTYLNASVRRERWRLLAVTPAAAWLGGWALYAQSPAWFWRLLAYLAAFHFVRQQYGFVRLYGRTASQLDRRLDGAAVYAATLYPLIYWHAHARAFAWFIAGDFVPVLPLAVERGAAVAYWLVMAAWVGRQTVLAARGAGVNVPKALVVAGTAVSWYVGIVALDGDATFTLINVVAHGVPYMGLVWGLQPAVQAPAPRRNAWAQTLHAAATFVALIALLAYVEEGLWDGLVWREHASLFPAFAALPSFSDRATLACLVPLLAMPQLTHYVIDGFIWRRPAPPRPPGFAPQPRHLRGRSSAPQPQPQHR